MRVRGRSAARRSVARAGLLRHRALALLAVRSGRLAGARPLGGAAGAHRAHPGRGEKCRAGARGFARAAAAHGGRAAGGRRGRPADRQHRRRSAATDFDPPRRPGQDRRRASRGGPRRVPTRRPSRRPGRAGAAARQGHRGVRRPHPAAEGPRHRLACRRETARGAHRGGRRAVGHRPGLAGRIGPAGRRTRHLRAGHVPAPAVPLEPGHSVPGGQSCCSAELFGVLRPGGAGGAGVRHPGGRGRGRRAAGGRARRRHRHPGGRARRRPLGRRAGRAAARARPGGRGDEPRGGRARRHLLLGPHHGRAAGQLPARDPRVHDRAPGVGA